MAFISWSDSYKIGNAEIDRQHQNFFSLIAKFHTCALNPKCDAAPVLNEILEYAVFHFAYEESEMQRVSYKDFNGHASQHNSILAELKKLVKSPNLKSDMFEVLIIQWLMKHMMTEDKKLAAALQPTTASSKRTLNF